MVVLIIGLLAGAVLKGAEMIGNSRVASTYMKVETTSRAVEAFIDKYRDLPGDMRNATDRLAGCTNSPANSCRNGDGDRNIGNVEYDNRIADAQDHAEDFENTLVWYHLSAARLMHEVDLRAPTTTRVWGRTNAEAPAGGGLLFRTMSGYLQDQPMDNYLKGIYLIWQRTPNGAADSGSNFIVSPKHAHAMDLKFDDGNPLTGKIRARGTAAGEFGDADGCRINTNFYNEGGSTSCYMYFRIREKRSL